MTEERKPRGYRRRLILALVVIVILIIVLLAVLPSSHSSGSGQFKLSGITVQWNGGTDTLLDTPYSSSPSDGGYGNSGFTFTAAFNDSGTCSGTASCFDPTASFSLASLTSGFQVSWVTARYQSQGYPAFVGPIYYSYASSPPSIPNGCASAGTDVDMKGVGLDTFVYLTVSVKFTGSGFSGSLNLQATALSPSQTISATTEDPTSTVIKCSPGTIPVQAVTPCTVTVTDIAASPRATAAPGGFVNFTASSGAFGPAPSCDLQSSQQAGSASASCQVNYEAATLGSITIFGSYSGDSTHNPSSAGFEVQTFEYMLTASPTNQTVVQCQGATYTIIAALMSGSATTNLPNVTLSVQTCNSLTMTCAFSPEAMVLTSGGGAARLVITPIQGAVQVPYSFGFSVVGTTGSGDFAFTVDSNYVSLKVT